jgi:hypothetical protein
LGAGEASGVPLLIVRIIVVAMIIGVVMMVIIPVVGHRVTDRSAAEAAHHRPDRPANDGAADGARNPSG